MLELAVRIMMAQHLLHGLCQPRHLQQHFIQLHQPQQQQLKLVQALVIRLQA